MSRVSNKAGTSLAALSWTLAAAGAALATTTSAHAQSVCLPVVGVNIQCGPADGPVNPVGPVLDLPPVAGPITATLADGFDSPDTVNLTTLGAGSDVNINALGSAVIDTVDQPGLVVNSGGAINGRVTDITTTGDGSEGALLNAVDDVVFATDGTVSTAGDNAPGLDFQGRSVTADANTVRTVGDNSNAATLNSLDGPTHLDADLLQTDGDLSDGALIRSNGTTDLSGRAIQTGGTNAVGFDISNDAAACVLLGAGGCDKNVDVDQVTTNGFGGIGGLVTGAGNTDIHIDTLQTGGDEAAGLDISTDPAACAALGEGSCGTAFTVQDLTTAGDRSPGAVVRGGGPIAANVGVLRTSGDQAAGLDLASDPTACAVLGAGQCGTSFSVGQLTTSGAGATGVLVRSAGPTTGHVGVLRTDGDGATGIDIGSDPTTCLLVGGGGCDVGLTGDNISTGGDGAGAVLINALGNVTTDLGALSTDGDNSTALSIIENPAVCLVLGPGSCAVDADVGPVNTGGDDSPGVTVVGAGDPVVVTTGPVTTGGDDSPGVTASGDGPIDVTTGPVKTSGDHSPGIVVAGGDDPVTVHAGSVTTGGDDSDGIDVTTTSGDQTIVAGPIKVTGTGSNGIVATSPGCSDINITATGAISAAHGTGIIASSACTVEVTTRAGAPVTGRVAGIHVTSGTGSTITIGDALSSADGPALDVDGAASVVTVRDGGSITGRFDLTDGNDRLVNDGTIAAVGDSSFGTGNDSFTNRGLFAVRRGSTTPGSVSLTGLESLANSGTVDLRNGVAGDTLRLPGSFTGSGDSTLGLDVSLAANGATADRLIVGGAATGNTTISLASLGTASGSLVDGLVLVDAGAGSTAGAFTLEDGGFARGLVRYSLAYDAADTSYALFGTPDAAAYELGKVVDGARQIFYRTNDAAAGHMQSMRDGVAGDAGDTPRRSSALWGQMFGSLDRTKSDQTVTVFGQTQTVALDNRQDFFGGQLGYDFGGVTGSDGVVFGVTGGYAGSHLGFTASADRLHYEAVNGGVYAGVNAGPFFLDGLAKYEFDYIDVISPAAGIRDRLHGHSYGGMAQAGLRLGSGGFFAEPAASIEYVRTSIDTLVAGPSTLDFDRGEGLRGKAGARIGTDHVSGASRETFYLSGNVVHDFKGRDGLEFASGNQSLPLTTDRIGTYGRATIGFNIVTGAKVNGFIEAYGDRGKDYSGGGGRAGLSVRF